MITTPISDFLDGYTSRTGLVRAHMPGHKGFLPSQRRDITEIRGADYLFAPAGIILESERNASRLFGSKATFYSTEGTSLSVKAALYLAMRAAPGRKKHRVVALRNVHKSFVSAAALLGFEIGWVYGTGNLLEREFPFDEIEKALSARPDPPDCLYVTGPDYLGRSCDIGRLARLAHKYDTFLVVDSAHGAYLRFLEPDTHPLSLGADIVCDSAHKTLPVLTGGAYLHLGCCIPDDIIKAAPEAMELFGSTSPSWLILDSLDRANGLLSGCRGFYEQAREKTDGLKKSLRRQGWDVAPSDPFRVTLKTKSFGYTGEQASAILEENGIFAEFCDRDYLVLMLTGYNDPHGLDRIENVLGTVPRLDPICEVPPEMTPPVVSMTPREALFARRETVPAAEAAGRVFLGCALSCPPAVPVIVAGETVGTDTVAALEYYGIKDVEVAG